MESCSNRSTSIVGGVDSGIGTAQDEMAAPPSSTSDVKYPDVFADIIALPGPGQVRLCRQRLNSLAQGIRIDASLAPTKVVRSPNQNVLEVSLGRDRHTNTPSATRNHHSQVDSRECSPIASRANSPRWQRSCSGASKLWKHPESMSAIPILAASRNPFSWASYYCS